jgi:hypothetical protein
MDGGGGRQYRQANSLPYLTCRIIPRLLRHTIRLKNYSPIYRSIALIGDAGHNLIVVVPVLRSLRGKEEVVPFPTSEKKLAAAAALAPGVASAHKRWRNGGLSAPGKSFRMSSVIACAMSFPSS